MKNNVVSFKEMRYEKMYKSFYSDINNYNMSVKMVGSAPKDIVKFKQVVNG